MIQICLAGDPEDLESLHCKLEKKALITDQRAFLKLQGEKEIATRGSGTSQTCKTAFSLNWWVSRVWDPTMKQNHPRHLFFSLLPFLPPLSPLFLPSFSPTQTPVIASSRWFAFASFSSVGLDDTSQGLSRSDALRGVIKATGPSVLGEACLFVVDRTAVINVPSPDPSCSAAPCVSASRLMAGCLHADSPPPL